MVSAICLYNGPPNYSTWGWIRCAGIFTLGAAVALQLLHAAAIISSTRSSQSLKPESHISQEISVQGLQGQKAAEVSPQHEDRV